MFIFQLTTYLGKLSYNCGQKEKDLSVVLFLGFSIKKRYIYSSSVSISSSFGLIFIVRSQRRDKVANFTCDGSLQVGDGAKETW